MVHKYLEQTDRFSIRKASASRLDFIDIARSVAVILAIFAHAMHFHDWPQNLDGPSTILRFTMRTATPLFLLMFGLMLELVYVRKADKTGLKSVTKRLIVRSGQCYLGYALTVLAGFISGYDNLEETILTLLFLKNSSLADILGFYCIVLLVAIPVIWLRLKFGLWILIVFLVLIWIGDIYLKQYTWKDFGMINGWVGILLGTGTYPFGPSVWHGFTFVLVGMVIANSLSTWREHNLQSFYKVSISFAIIALAVILHLVNTASLAEVFENFHRYTAYRAHNHYGYYAIGSFTGIVTLILLSKLYPLGQKLPSSASKLLVLGRSSLLSFSLGNIFLNLIPASKAELFAPFAIQLGIILVSIIFVQLTIMERLLNNDQSQVKQQVTQTK